MNGWRGAAALGLTAVALSTGCATSGLSNRPDPAAEELAELQRKVLELQRKAAVSEVEIDRLRRKVAELENRLGRSTPASGGQPSTGQAPPAAPATRSASPLPQEHAPTAAEPPLIEEVDLPEESARNVASPRPAAGGPLPAAGQALYDQGYALYHQGQYLDAEASFQRFLQSYAATELGDNALYWVGESRWARGDLEGALAAFRETVERYPEGNKVPDALLKAGQSLEALEDLEGARATYQEVMRRFGGTPAAEVAREHLQRLP